MTFNFINLMGAGMIAVLLIPNILFSAKAAGEDRCKGSCLSAAEQLGRYGSMILSVLPLFYPGGEFGFASAGRFAAWLILIPCLAAAYYICWFVYSKRRFAGIALALAAIPSAVFLLHGILLQNLALCGFAAVFAVCHIANTFKNTRQEPPRADPKP